MGRSPPQVYYVAVPPALASAWAAARVAASLALQSRPTGGRTAAFASSRLVGGCAASRCFAARAAEILAGRATRATAACVWRASAHRSMCFRIAGVVTARRLRGAARWPLRHRPTLRLACCFESVLKLWPKYLD